MRRLLILMVLSLAFQYSFGQACGLYRIKYVGKVKSDSLQIENIKLPSIQFLHGLEDEKSELGSYTSIPNTGEIDVEIGSHTTSHLYDKSEDLLNFYRRNREGIPIVITVIKLGKSEEIRVDLTWDNIQINKLEDQSFGNLFELNLNVININ